MEARTSVGRIRADGQHGRSVSVWVESLAGLDHKTDHIIRLGEGWGEDTKGGIQGGAETVLEEVKDVTKNGRYVMSA